MSFCKLSTLESNTVPNLVFILLAIITTIARMRMYSVVDWPFLSLNLRRILVNKLFLNISIPPMFTSNRLIVKMLSKLEQYF